MTSVDKLIDERLHLVDNIQDNINTCLVIGDEEDLLRLYIELEKELGYIDGLCMALEDVSDML